MKIVDIHIEKMRGIKDISLELNGKSTVVVGPNGVGKSTVADAIDFLFTGKINRLTGEGTGSLKKMSAFHILDTVLPKQRSLLH